MTRSWRALPIGTTEVSLKAPSYREHLIQQRPGWKPRRSTAEEVLVAQVIMDALDAEEVRVPQGRTYKVWRWPLGLAVETPEGWVVYRPMESQVRSRGAFKVASEERSFTAQDD